MDKLSFGWDFLSQEVGKLFGNYLKEKVSHKFFETIEYEDTSSKNLISIKNKKIREILSEIDFMEIFQFNEELADAIEEQFQRVEWQLTRYFLALQREIFDIFSEEPALSISENFHFRNHPKKLRLNEFKSREIGKLINISAEVVSISEEFPILKRGVFQCQDLSCGFFVEKNFRISTNEEPLFCPNCGNSTGWLIDIKNSDFKSFSLFKIKILPDSLLETGDNYFLDIIVDSSSSEDKKTGDAISVSGYFFPIRTKKPFLNLKRESSSKKYLTSFMKHDNIDKLEKNSFDLIFKAHTIIPLTRINIKEGFFSESSPLGYIREIFNLFKTRRSLDPFSYLFYRKKINFFDSQSLILIIVIFLSLNSRGDKSGTLHNSFNVCFYAKFNDLKIFGAKILVNLFFGDALLEFYLKSSFYFSNTTENLSLSHLNFEHKKFFSSFKRKIQFCGNYDRIPFFEKERIIQASKNQLCRYQKKGKILISSLEYSILAFCNLENSEINQRSFSTINLENMKKNLTDFDFNLITIKDLSVEKLKSYSNEILRSYSGKRSRLNDLKTVQILKPYLVFSSYLRPVITENTSFMMVQVYKYLRRLKFSTPLGHFIPSFKDLETILKISIGISKFILSQKVTIKIFTTACRFFFDGLSLKPDFSVQTNSLLQLHTSIDSLGMNENAGKNITPSNISERNYPSLILKSQEFIFNEIEYWRKKNLPGISLKKLIKKVEVMTPSFVKREMKFFKKSKSLKFFMKIFLISPGINISKIKFTSGKHKFFWSMS